MKRFKWTVEFEVDDNWVVDGFDLTEDRATDMIMHQLPFAVPHEVKATIKKSPPPDEIKKAHGYLHNA